MNIRNQTEIFTFPALIYYMVINICQLQNINIPDTLRYLKVSGLTSFLSTPTCNLQQLYINPDSNMMVFSESIMKAISISNHGGLVVHVVLVVAVVEMNGIDALVENSPNLIILHIYRSQIELDLFDGIDTLTLSLLKKK